MVNYEITYKKICSICGKRFFPKRKHAITCSTKCRSILHKLKIGAVEFSSQIGYKLFPLNGNELNKKIEYVRNAKMCDVRGNSMEFINGYTDENGKIIRLVFRNATLRYLEVWDDYGSEINEMFYKF